jgi:hypothetical protein
MLLTEYFLSIVFIYFLLVFVGFRLVVPFMGFKQYSPPIGNLPQEIKQAVSDLEIKSHDQMSYLEAAYGLIMQKNFQQWKHSRFYAAVRPYRAFITDISELWNTNEFIYCTSMNFLLYTLLANSKFFKSSDVKLFYSFANMIIHQYMKIKVGDKWIDADPAGTGIKNKPLGTHLAGFG